MATSFSSSMEYCASSTLRWLSACLLTCWFWMMKLRNGSRLRSLSTKSFSVYSGPLSSRGKLEAEADAVGGVRVGGGGVGALVVGVLPQATAAGSATQSARTSNARGRRLQAELTWHLRPRRQGRVVCREAPAWPVHAELPSA